MLESSHTTLEPSTPQQQSWGAVIAIVVILAMIVIGAFYAWNKRLGKEPGGAAALATTTATTTP
ncbi:MAG: hypothetical protein B7X04_02490 [Parcubacteria group bacterium 21-54-25]|nr:MAG: hypothetical protein B7X04_02490 [Parcubacteria group bacterium 21-54-25]HQU07776.1 hypothetical protein [Candidatus Paceibacterota bacterium]